MCAMIFAHRILPAVGDDATTLWRRGAKHNVTCSGTDYTSVVRRTYRREQNNKLLLA